MKKMLSVAAAALIVAPAFGNTATVATKALNTQLNGAFQVIGLAKAGHVNGVENLIGANLSAVNGAVTPAMAAALYGVAQPAFTSARAVASLPNTDRLAELARASQLTPKAAVTTLDSVMSAHKGAAVTEEAVRAAFVEAAEKSSNLMPEAIEAMDEATVLASYEAAKTEAQNVVSQPAADPAAEQRLAHIVKASLVEPAIACATENPQLCLQLAAEGVSLWAIDGFHTQGEKATLFESDLLKAFSGSADMVGVPAVNVYRGQVRALETPAESRSPVIQKCYVDYTTGA
ncbi:hypothetical protein K2X33_07035 [bacterium]|nr:hypothetical protein [bacterium]